MLKWDGESSQILSLILRTTGAWEMLRVEKNQSFPGKNILIGYLTPNGQPGKTSIQQHHTDLAGNTYVFKNI